MNRIDICEEIGARSPGWFKAECHRCGDYATGSEPTVEDWAYQHSKILCSGRFQVTWDDCPLCLTLPNPPGKAWCVFDPSGAIVDCSNRWAIAMRVANARAKATCR